MNKKAGLLVALLAIIVLIYFLFFNHKKSDKNIDYSSTLNTKNATKQSNVTKEEEHEEHYNRKILSKDSLKIAQDFKSVKQILNVNFYEPKFCKNKKAFVFTNHDGNKLFIKYANNDKYELLTEGEGFYNNYNWDKNCENIIFKRKINYKYVFYSFNLETKQITKIDKDIPELATVESFSISDTIYFLDKENLQIHAKYKSNVWKVTNNDNNDYFSILPSPNGKKLIAHQGPNICLIDLKTNKETIVGTGLITAWSDDSNYFIGYKDLSKDGHEMSNSDLYLYNVKDLVPNQITNTSEIYETTPFFIDDKTIGFTDAKNGGVYQQQITLE